MPALLETAETSLAPHLQSQNPYSLTAVEKDILDKTSLGQGIGEMAVDLCCGLHEIYSLQRQIAWQFGTISNAAATNRAIQRGILAIEFDSNPIETNIDERKFLRLLASGRDFRHIGHHFNYAKRDTIAFFCTHMAIMLDAKVDVANEEVSHLVRRGHELRLLT